MAKTIYWYEHRSNKKRKKLFWKDFFKLMNNAVFGKTIENLRKHRRINLVTTERRTNYLVSEPNDHTTFHRISISNRNQKTEILINKPVYLGLSILHLSTMLKYEFWYDYVKPKYGEKTKLCNMDTDSFSAYIKTDDLYKDFAGHIGTRFDTWNYELDRPLPKGKNKKVIELMNDELGRKIMTKYFGLRAIKRKNL